MPNDYEVNPSDSEIVAQFRRTIADLPNPKDAVADIKSIKASLAVLAKDSPQSHQQLISHVYELARQLYQTQKALRGVVKETEHVVDASEKIRKDAQLDLFTLLNAIKKRDRNNSMIGDLIKSVYAQGERDGFALAEELLRQEGVQDEG